MAPLEAMACGTPVVAVAEGGVKETMIHGITGLTTTRDVNRFAGSLDYLLSNNTNRQRMGQAGINYVREQWSWQKAIDQLEAQFSNV